MFGLGRWDQIIGQLDGGAKEFASASGPTFWQFNRGKERLRFANHISQCAEVCLVD